MLARSLVLVAGLGLAVASCGSGTDDPSTADADTTTSASTPATTTGTTGTTAAPTTTTQAPSTTTIPDPEGLESLVAGHNDPAADRINVVFAPWGWDDPADFRAVAELFAGWDGTAQGFDLDGLPAAGAEATDADLGLFGWEPFRSNRDRFNVWLTDRSPEEPADWINEPTAPVLAPDQVIVILARDLDLRYPGVSSYAGQDQAPEILGPEPSRVAQPFADAVVLVDGDYPAGAMRDVPHELGHALFGFADEYVGRLGPEDVSPRNDFWPSCAASREVAEAWWDDLVGRTDPMVDVWATEMAAAGFPPDESYLAVRREDLRTAFVEEGCFGVPGSYRSAVDTMMGFNAPGYGLTNERAARRVIELWTG